MLAANYTVIGTGGVAVHIGTALAKLPSTSKVIFASRDPQSDKVKKVLDQVGPKAVSLTHTEAVSASQVVFVATPGGAPAVEVVTNLYKAGALKPIHIVVDLTNPFDNEVTSGGERMQAIAPQIRVVKAFNTCGSNKFVEPTVGTEKIDMFVAANDADARKEIMQLANAIGFSSVDAGGIASSRWMEALCYGWVHMAHAQKLGRNIGWKLLH